MKYLIINLKAKYVKIWGVMFLLASVLYGLDGSIIIPYVNYGEMAKSTPVIVLATAKHNYELEELDGMSYYETYFSVNEIIKGEISQNFSVRNETKILGDLITETDGDVKFEAGHTYLLLLDSPKGRIWQTRMLSYGILVEKMVGSVLALVPVEESMSISYWSDSNVEPIVAYEKQGLISMFREILENGGEWNSENIALNYSLRSKPKIFTRAEPSHCTYLSNSRWENLDTDPLPIYSHVDGDSYMENVAGIVQEAILELKQNYRGIDIQYGGTHQYEPSSNAVSAIGSEFTSYSSRINRGRSILIQYNDPKDEIKDIDYKCEGVLAKGGTFRYANRSHTFNGEDWNPNVFGFVVVNDTAGVCLKRDQYLIMMIHELTHALGIGHIPLSHPANMNPACCVDITDNDIACIDFAYSAQALPIELSAFYSEKRKNSLVILWEMVNQLNISHFELEHSVNGKDFNLLEFVMFEKNDEKTTTYQVFHPQPKPGYHFYRLKQLELDGSISYSSVISYLWLEKENELSIYPNPTRDVIEVKNLSFEPAKYVLRDMTGKIVQKGTLTDHSINIKAVKSGLYVITLVQGSRYLVERIAIL